MASPWLLTSTTMSAPSALALTLTAVPGVAYSMAFLTRLEGLPHAIGIPVARHVAFDLRQDGRLELLDDVPEDLTQIRGLPFDGQPAAETSLGEIEELTDHLGHALAAANDARDRL